MKKLCLLFLVCAACGAKKPATKQPAPSPPEEQGKTPDTTPKSEPAAAPRISDPCDGGQKPH